MKVLVTGGAGFIGSHVVDLLIENNYKVCVIDNLSNGNINNVNKKATFYCMDIMSKNINEIFEKEKPDVLIHNAAQISVSNSLKDPLHDAQINVLGSLNIFECCRKFNVKKIIYPASAAIFGEPQYLPIDEQHPLEMISFYGVTKHTVEHYLKIYKYMYNIDYVVFRYSNVYGPRQDSTGEGGVVAIFCEKMIKGENPHIFGDGEQTRDFIYVKDVAKANMLAIQNSINDIYNICTNNPITINKLFYNVKNILKKDIKPKYDKSRDGDIKYNYMSYDKFKNILNWEPEISLYEGLKETIQYYKNIL